MFKCSTCEKRIKINKKKNKEFYNKKIKKLGDLSKKEKEERLNWEIAFTEQKAEYSIKGFYICVFCFIWKKRWWFW